MSKRADRIEIGDIVRVDIHGGHCTIAHAAEVKYMPCHPGDGWTFRNVHTQEIHYVSEGCTVTLKEKGRDNDAF